LTKKRVLITGAAGFIGSHLTDYLLARDYDVIGMDNFVTGDPANLEHIQSKDFTLIEHDVSNEIEIEGPLDYILHFASPASPIDYLELPIQTLKVGSLGTHKTLGLARAKGATFLLASTSEVYGDPLVHPQKEEYWGNVNPVGPRGVYAYHRYHGINVKIARIFNTFGPRMRLRDGRAIPAFISQALQGEPFTVFGNGKQTRSFCFISDLVEGLSRLLMSDYNLPVNLGNPREMTILELAEAIKAMTGSTSPIDFRPLPVDDPRVRQPDISLAQRLLDWEPRVSLSDGLKDTVDYFRKKLGIS
jgi:dTDP-glucose 4,6-dehydratase